MVFSKKMNFLFVLVLISLMAAINAQSCISPRGFNPNVCEFTPSSSFFNDATQQTANKCSTANTNPFSTFPPTANAPQNQAQCNAAIQTDGSSCVNAYAKFQCANRCSLCNQDPCKSLCTALSAECPTALSQNCFQFALCATSDSNCVNWGIDSSKIPTFTTTTTKPASTSTTTKAVTTTKAGSTSASTNTASTTSSGTSTTSGVGVIQINRAMLAALCFITLLYSFIF